MNIYKELDVISLLLAIMGLAVSYVKADKI